MPSLWRLKRDEYNIYLSWNNNAEAIRIPVMPEKMQLKRKGNGKVYDIVGLGQINAIQARDLAEISFESFFPRVDQSNPKLIDVNPKLFPVAHFVDSGHFQKFKLPFVKAKKMTPSQYIHYLTKWQDSKYPIRFIYTSPEMSINLPVSIESFDRWESAGSEGDVYYQMTLKEFVFHAARRIDKGKDTNGNDVLKDKGKSRLDERVPPNTYTLKSGDSLILVARKQLGDSGRWKEIQKLNEISDAQLKKLPIGKVLKLPKRK
ncbi:peptidoglycan-binding protein LysM [Paenibacillus baekrokdamisoli]|uniref:Peptidoglycan-binding protein LysM n=1 Tax=Paenibacillus baekrokdamisoli TaxID=1712516 RepID=A0A3G9INP7_9BACL|nr:LysM peptidoglycan-binding domain-containing protein [Paenibacillus baekrokdamisoli]MBB3070513.1 nucleoid-associated protein YgaU [Paenibacillus baekrokdamisoli]BBH19862.1 peptidoglycan-binding protein LysM [Paenibacillus baekrokdamisoli]